MVEKAILRNLEAEEAWTREKEEVGKEEERPSCMWRVCPLHN